MCKYVRLSMIVNVCVHVLCKCVGSFVCSRSCSSFKLYILDAVHLETVVGRRTNRSLVSPVTITLINQAWVAADQTDWCPHTLTTGHKSKVITAMTILSFFCWPTATHREFFLLFCDTSDEGSVPEFCAWPTYNLVSVFVLALWSYSLMSYMYWT